MKSLITIATSLLLSVWSGSEQEQKNKIAVEFYYKGKLVQRYESQEWIAWECKKENKFYNFGSDNFEADSVSAKLVTASDNLMPF